MTLYLLQVYISACFSGIHSRSPQSCDVNYYPSHQLNLTSRQRSVPAVLNELSMDSRLIKFLETKGHKASSAMVVKIPTEQVLRDQSDQTQQVRTETNFIDMLTQKLAEQASLHNKSPDLLDPSRDSNGSVLDAGKIQRRLHNADVLNSPRFRQRRDALGNILDIVDVKQLRKQLSVPANLGTQPFFQITVPEAVSQKITQIDAPLAF